MPSIQVDQLKSGRFSYRLEWRAAGRKSKQKLTVYDSTLAEAAQKLIEAHGNKITRPEIAAILEQRFGGTEQQVRVSTAPLFADYARGWLRRHESNVSAGTAKVYERNIRLHLTPTFGEWHMDRITDDAIEDWKVAQRDRGLSPKSIQDQMRLCQSILASAQGVHYEVSPAHGVQPPQVTLVEQVILTTQEFYLAHAQCERSIQDLVRFAANSGARIGEICGLRVCDVVTNARGTSVMITRSAKAAGGIGDPKSRASIRPVSISPGQAAMLRRLTSGRPATAPLFAAPGGGHWRTDAVRYRWEKAVRAAMRCEVHPPETANSVSACECMTRLHQRPRLHDLRHTHVSWLADLGWQIDEVQHRLGHAKLETTYSLYWRRFKRHDGQRLAALDSYETAA